MENIRSRAVSSELISHLSRFISDARRKKFEEVLNNRTRHLAVVLEDIYQPHNASAVLRSCDCFGIQDVHIIENRNKYTINPDVELGASKWLSLYKYNRQAHNTAACLEKLKQEGYAIAVTSLSEPAIPIRDVPVTRKTALVFGTEISGITPEAAAQADVFVRIPMFGFTDSFNISVSAALCLYELTSQLRKERPRAWQLSAAEKEDLLLEWLRVSIHKSDLIEKEFLEKRNE